MKKSAAAIKITAILLLVLGIVDLIYGTITSTFFLVPLTFTYVGIGWIVAALAIITAAGLWPLRKWGYRMGLLFGIMEILMVSLNLLFAFSGYWEQFVLNRFDLTLTEVGYTYESLISESMLNSLPYFLLSGLFLVGLWRVKPKFDPSGLLLNYLKLANRAGISELALKTGLTQVEVELMSQHFIAMGEPLEIDLNAREVIFKISPSPPP